METRSPLSNAGARLIFLREFELVSKLLQTHGKNPIQIRNAHYGRTRYLIDIKRIEHSRASLLWYNSETMLSDRLSEIRISPGSGEAAKARDVQLKLKLWNLPTKKDNA